MSQQPILSKIQETLDLISVESLETDTKALDEALQNIVDRHRMVDIIKEILSSESRLDEVARNSYSHPNGFDKLVIVTGDQGKYKLRCHIWWPEESFTHREDIHNHRWNFATRLIRGTYLLEFYNELSGDPTHFVYRYQSPEENETFDMSILGERKLALSFRTKVQAGSGYSQSYDLLHRVTKADNKLVVTLLLQGKTVCDHTTVYAEETLNNNVVGNAVRFSRQGLTSRLLRLVAVLEGND